MAKETSKLSGPVTEENKKKKTVFNRVMTILEIVVLVCLVVVSVPLGITLVRNYAYGETFFVNGQSMYPTLNGHGLRITGNSSYRQLTWADGNSVAHDLLDYGWAKPNKGDAAFYENLHRYDVVMCHYSKDYVSVENRQLRSSASLKVKRIIGLPGETVRISFDPSDKDKVDNFYGYTVWGETRITKPTGEAVTLKNLYSADDFPNFTDGAGITRNYLSSGNPVVSSSTPNTAKTIVYSLGKDEYFVCGDNRRYSDDSRANGAIKDFMINGKACLVTGMREYLPNPASGTSESEFRWDKMRMPWDYINLESKDPKEIEL